MVSSIGSFCCCGFCGFVFGSFGVVTTIIVCDSVLIDASRKMLVAVEKNSAMLSSYAENFAAECGD